MHNEAYLQLKYAAMPPETDAAASNGLAELERVFGDANANFLLQKGGLPTSGSSSNAATCAYGHDALQQAQRSSRRATQSESECSDIDCEQLDDDDEDTVE